jgi:hypothetical protein
VIRHGWNLAEARPILAALLDGGVMLTPDPTWQSSR